MKFRIFWDVAPCSHVEVDWRFRGAYCLHHQGSTHLWNRSTSTWLHGATSQKILNFIFAAVRTWTLTYLEELTPAVLNLWSADHQGSVTPTQGSTTV
jgi:hypothetical protein